MSEHVPQKRRTWIWVVIGIFFVLVVLAIGGVLFTVSFFRQSMTITDMNPTSADAQFAAVRGKFGGQEPLIRMVDGQPQYDDDRASTSPSTKPLQTMHVMAWDDDEEKLVTFALPFWLLRMKSGPIRLSAYSQGWDDRGVSFRIEDLERHGPGLLLDANERSEGRVLIWVE